VEEPPRRKTQSRVAATLARLAARHAEEAALGSPTARRPRGGPNAPARDGEPGKPPAKSAPQVRGSSRARVTGRVSS